MIYLKWCRIIVALFCLNLIEMVNAQTIIIRCKNSSDYDGRWKLTREIPRFLQIKLKKGFKHNIKIQNNFNSPVIPKKTILLDLDIQKFRFYGYNIANYRVGGYNNYRVQILCKMKIIKNDDTEVYEVEGLAIDSNLGFTILGGPGGDDDIGQNPYVRIQGLRFGSRKFMKTVYGKALIRLSEKINKHLLKNISKNKKKK